MSSETKILLFEPVPADAELIELQIRKSGLNVFTRRVSSRELFVKAIEEFDPDIAIVTTSIPRLDVPEMIRAGRTDYPRVRWVVVAAAGSEELAAKCLKAGAVDYVPKKAVGHLGEALKLVVEEAEAMDEQAEEEFQPEEVEEFVEEDVSEEAPPAADDWLYRAIVENAHDLIAVLDLEGKRVYNSPSYGPMLEDPDTLEGTSSFVDIHPEDRQKVMDVFRETVAEGEGKRLEYRLMDRDGNTKYIESQGSVIRDEEGNPKYVVIFSRDITARRMAGEIIRWTQEQIAGLAGEDFFPGLVQAVADGLGVKYALVSDIVDRRTGIVNVLAFWASGSLAPNFQYDVHGTTCEQVVLNGKTMYFPEDVQAHFPTEAVLKAMNAYAYLGTPLLDASNDPIGHLFIIHDRPFLNEEMARSVLMVAASRASAQLSHLRDIRFREESELRTRMLLEDLPEGVIVTDLEDVVKFVNRGMCALTGYDQEEIVGKLASSLLLTPEGRRDLFIHNDRRRRGLSERYESTLTHKDGSMVDVTISAGPQRSPSGEVIGTLALVVPRSGAETPQGSTEAGLLGKTQDAVFVCDLDDTILFWNSAAEQLYGWTAEEVRGKKSVELLHTAEIHQLGGAAHTAAIDGYWGGELRQKRKDGSPVLVDSRWTLIRSDEGKPVSLLVLCTDITGRKEMEVYALRVRRMGGIASLGSAIASDLERVFNPMLIALAHVAENITDEETREAIKVFAVGAMEGRELAYQIRALAETGTGGSGFYDPAAAVRAVEQSFRVLLTGSERMEIETPRNLWPVAVPQQQLEAVLGNIVTNAREAMPAGGTIRLTTENRLIDQVQAKNFRAAPGRYVMITVSDSGIGIPAANIDKVVLPFFTTKPPGKTTGLGLSTAVSTLKGHRGFLSIHSEQGKGTIVRVFVPAAQEEGEADGLGLGHGETVLIAHAQGSMRDLLRKILEAHGYVTLVASDAEETMALFEEHRESVGCVLLDLALPSLDGTQIVDLLRVVDPEVRIITTDDLPHPFSTPTLLKRISTLLGR